MAGWQTPGTLSRLTGGDIHPDSDEGRAETWVKREDGYVVCMQAWRFEQMVKQAGFDSAPPPVQLTPEEAGPLVAEQDRINKARVDKSNWKQVIEEARVKAEASSSSTLKLEELEARISAQDVKLDAILAALQK